MAHMNQFALLNKYAVLQFRGSYQRHLVSLVAIEKKGRKWRCLIRPVCKGEPHPLDKTGTLSVRCENDPNLAEFVHCVGSECVVEIDALPVEGTTLMAVNPGDLISCIEGYVAIMTGEPCNQGWTTPEVKNIIEALRLESSTHGALELETPIPATLNFVVTGEHPSFSTSGYADLAIFEAERDKVPKDLAGARGVVARVLSHLFRSRR
ncbi:hypothetical protein K466DRAFT_585857 [Polyporus arcularius HHB13444]|uniref:Uncharacterized protein n=1 Tax=Polyporus arcularius HHB13444 TaxID=1314778 RepID=A0A5C3PGT1_9APHY|nr:hypothetical protein K466DRAFT_585857 [Polyporus arcularius HHB13444]